MVRFAEKMPEMKIHSIILSLLCLAVATNAATAKNDGNLMNLRFSGLTSGDGLSQNSVVTITEDRRGNIWMGTDDGLNRYDGYDISVYRHDPEDANTIQSNIINKVYIDSSGRLWACTANGLSIYDERLDRFSRIQLDGIHSVEDIIETGDGRMLLTTRNASYIYDCKVRNCTEFRIDGKPFRFYASYRDGDDIILCSMSRFVETLNSSNGQLSRKHPPLAIPNFGRAILPVGDGLCIIGSNGSGALLADVRNGSFEPCFQESGQFVNALAKDSRGLVWAGGANGLMAYDENGKCVYRSDPGSSVERLVRSIFSAVDGGLWVGTNYAGVKFLNGRKERFAPLSFADESETLADDIVTGLAASDDGSLWIGTRYGGLSRFGTLTGQRKNWHLDNVHCFYSSPDGKTVYAGSEINGLGIIDMKSGTMRTITRPSDVMAICGASDGKLWLGSLVGLFLFSPESLSMTKVQLGAPGNITRILTLGEDRDGNLWVGSKESLKVYRQEAGNRLTEITPPEFDNLIQVQCLSFDKNGSVRIGTADGLLLWETQSEGDGGGRLTRVPWLQSATVRGIEEDPDGSLWISTDNYLYHCDLKSGERRLYKAGGDFPCNQFSTYAHCRGNGGRLYFGGITGIGSFIPDELGTDTTTVAPVLSGLMLNNLEVRPGDGTGILQCSISSTDGITLKHYQNSITLRFSCPDFRSEHGNSFRYRLDGLDKDWINARSREATYSNLDKGKYVFRVMAANSDGIWNPTEARLEIRVRPIWYRSTPARIAFALAALALLGCGAYRLIRSINRRNERRMAEMASRYENKIRRARLDRFVEPSYQLRPQDEDFLTKVLECIERNCSDSEFGVEKLAEELCMSRGNLHLKIKTTTGRTPIELIKTVRMEKACGLLKEGKLPVAEIAEQCGFQTSSYFITAFKKTFGMTPGKYSSLMH